MDAAAVKRLFDGRLATYKHPRDVIFADDLPRTAIGKVDRNRLRQSLVGVTRADEYSVPFQRERGRTAGSGRLVATAERE